MIPDRLAAASTTKLANAIFHFAGFMCILVGSYLLWGWSGWLFTFGTYVIVQIMFDRLIETVRR